VENGRDEEARQVRQVHKKRKETTTTTLPSQEEEDENQKESTTDIHFNLDPTFFLKNRLQHTKIKSKS
jgi:hypothetical protein